MILLLFSTQFLTDFVGRSFKLGAPQMATDYFAGVSIKLSAITISVLDIGSNVAALNASATILIDVSSPDMTLTGTLIASIDGTGHVVFSNIFLEQPRGGLHTLTFTSHSNSTVTLLPITINVTISPGSPYYIRSSSAYNTTLPCAYPIIHIC